MAASSDDADVQDVEDDAFPPPPPETPPVAPPVLGSVVDGEEDHGGSGSPMSGSDSPMTSSKMTAKLKSLKSFGLAKKKPDAKKDLTRRRVSSNENMGAARVVTQSILDAEAMLQLGVQDVEVTHVAAHLKRKPMRNAKKTVPVRDLKVAFASMQTSKDLRDLVLYLFFVGLYLAIVKISFPIRSMHDQITLIEDLFLDEEFSTSLDVGEGEFSGPLFKKNYYDIYSFAEYWEWVEGPLLNAIFSNEYWDGAPITNPADMFTLQFGESNNRVVGSIQFRTIRVRPNSGDCKTLAPAPTEWNASCLPEYSPDAELTEPWNEGVFTQLTEDSSFVRGVPGYGPSDWRIFSWFTGSKGYGERGYVYSIPLVADSSALQVAQDHVKIMKDHNWTDAGTRVLVVDFNVAGLNQGNIIAVRFAVQVLEGGSFHPYWRAYPILTQPTKTDSDKTVLVLTSIFLCLLTYYWYAALADIYQHQRHLAYLVNKPFEVLNLLNLGIFVLAFALLFNNMFNKFDDDYVRAVTFSSEYQDIFNDARFFSYVWITNAANMVLCSFKIFKFLKRFPRFSDTFDALRYAMPELITLTVTLFVLTFGLAMFGHLLFGLWVTDFHTVTSSISLLLRAIVGSFEYDEIRDTEPTLAPIYYCLVLFLEVAVLLNMFIAIVSDFYILAKERNKLKRRLKKQVGTVMVISRLGAIVKRCRYQILRLYAKKHDVWCCSRRERAPSTSKSFSVKLRNTLPLGLLGSHSTSNRQTGVAHQKKHKKKKESLLVPLFKSSPSNWGVVAPRTLLKERAQWLRDRQQALTPTLELADGVPATPDEPTKEETEQLRKQKKAAKFLGLQVSKSTSADAGGAGLGELGRDDEPNRPGSMSKRATGLATQTASHVSDAKNALSHHLHLGGVTAGLSNMMHNVGHTLRLPSRDEHRSLEPRGSTASSSDDIDTPARPSSMRNSSSRGVTSESIGTDAGSTRDVPSVGKLMWQWATQEIAINRQLRIIEERKKLGDSFKAQVQRTREWHDRKYGVETYFRRNWDAVRNSRNIRYKKALADQQFKAIPVELEINDLLWRAVRRQAKQKVDLFTVLDKTWKRMAPTGKLGELGRDELLILLGGSPDPASVAADNGEAAAAEKAGDEESQELTEVERDVDMLIDLYNRHIRPATISTRKEYDDGTTLENVETKVSHVENILTDILKRHRAGQ